MNRILCHILAVFCGVAACPQASACAACFGKSDSPLAYGMNAGIYVLLAVIGSMLGLIASFFVFVSRRAARIAGAELDSTDATV
ncbi:MAG: hypothetical protein RIS76_262 [Verrucomicrobiota bacterium]